MSSNTLTIISVLLNFLGTASLAFAANRYFKAVNNSFIGAEKSIEGLAECINDPHARAPIFTGFDIHRSKGMKFASFLTYLGLSLIGLGIVCQLLTLK